MIRGIGLASVFAMLSSTVLAQALDPAPLEPAGGGERFSFTPSIGYLGAKSTENVYNTGNRTDKLSQLDWKADAVTLGGRAAVQVFDGLTLRGSLWAAVSSGADMRDRDWFLGYQGPDSWTHQSVHPDTRVPKAWQGDISAAYTLTNMGDVGIAGLAASGVTM